MQEIKEKAFIGMIWRGGYHAFHQVISLVVKIILVRILLPDDFGLIAMAMIVFSSLDIINRFAGGEPYIRDNTSDPQRAKNTLFMLNLLFLGSTIFIGFISAPYIARFFGQKISDPQSITTLIWIIRIFALRLILSLAANVSMAALTKKLKFKQLYIGNITGTSAYFLFAPILAFLGLGVWAIVLAHVIEQIVITIFYLYYEPYKPAFTFDREIAKNYIQYNSNLFINALILIVINYGDDTAIGRLMGPAMLGFYNIGQNFSLFVNSFISNNIREITFPILAEIQDDRDKFSRAFFKSFRMINLFTIPAVAGSVILAREIILILFGQKWLPILPIFYILSISAVLESIHSMASPVLKSINKPHLIRNSQLIRLVFFVALIYPSVINWGYIGVSWLMVILSLIPLIYLGPKVSHEIKGLYRQCLGYLSYIIPCTLLMMAVVYFAKRYLPSGILWILASGLAGAVVYLVPISRVDREFKEDIRSAIKILKTRLGLPNSLKKPKEI